MDNKHVQAIPPAVIGQAQLKINEALAMLHPYVTSLTPTERHTLPKMGEKTLSFVEKAYEFARQNPTLCPQYLDMYLFDIDFADAHGLWTLLNTATQLQENIDDTAMCAGSESYQAGRDAAAGGWSYRSENHELAPDGR
ncbi:MAG: hypothetical protein LBQ54_08285 [Planctomycetaceae bacterium]|jgi:hypothetical protein|nr:hypothetical protein [Planctomycetaceae bacterium]